ncbi:MAG: hypothetical protein KC912_05345 [Proteobacteria bacterium]|nr:hypothetical protein [Pseudomonadota bacterium]
MRTLLIIPLLGSGCLALVDPCEIEDGNLLGNSDFSELTCWYDGNDHDWTDVTTTLVEGSPGSGAPVLRAENTIEGSSTFEVQLMQGPYFSSLRDAPLGIESGDAYRMTFWAKATPPRDILVQVASPTSPWTFTAVQTYDEWTEHTLTGIAGAGEEEDAWFEIQFGGDVGVVYIDDVTLQVTDDD